MDSSIALSNKEKTQSSLNFDSFEILNEKQKKLLDQIPNNTLGKEEVFERINIINDLIKEMMSSNLNNKDIIIRTIYSIQEDVLLRIQNAINIPELKNQIGQMEKKIIVLNEDDKEQKNTINELKESSKKQYNIIQEQTLEIKQLEEACTKDCLTGIYNRRFFDFTLDKELLRMQRSKNPISAIMIDIDNFKQYNDKYGHPKGDECLQDVTKAINKIIKRPADFLARYGGEEFAIILPETNKEGAYKIADEIKEVLSKLNITHEFSNAAKHVSVSMGISTIILNEEKEFTKEDIIKIKKDFIEIADKALYRSKNSGKNCYYHAEDITEEINKEITEEINNKNNIEENIEAIIKKMQNYKILKPVASSWSITYNFYKKIKELINTQNLNASPV